jgi:CRISPR-associated protein Cas1
VRKLLNVLYVTQSDSYLAADGETVLIKQDGKTLHQIPIHILEGIICLGFAGASPKLMSLCCEKGVALSFLTSYGTFQGRVTGRISGNVLLRRAQYRWADDADITLRLAKRFVSAKMVNSRALLLRGRRDHPESVDEESMGKALKRIAGALPRLTKATSCDEVRGIEGEAAHAYFSVFDQLVLCQNEMFFLAGRQRRPPMDNLNSLLSFLYTLLAHEATAALESVGLDPQVGFLHRERPGRQSLALDLMEELRAHFADRLAITLINRKQITGDGFLKKENGSVVMNDSTRNEVLKAWQNRKLEEITHPYLDEKIPFGLVPYVQALLLARHLRGDLEDYPPFFWK